MPPDPLFFLVRYLESAKSNYIISSLADENLWEIGAIGETRQIQNLQH